jgi:hypothetical protein
LLNLNLFLLFLVRAVVLFGLLLLVFFQRETLTPPRQLPQYTHPPIHPIAPPAPNPSPWTPIFLTPCLRAILTLFLLFLHLLIRPIELLVLVSFLLLHFYLSPPIVLRPASTVRYLFQLLFRIWRSIKP